MGACQPVPEKNPGLGKGCQVPSRQTPQGGAAAGEPQRPGVIGGFGAIGGRSGGRRARGKRVEQLVGTQRQDPAAVSSSSRHPACLVLQELILSMVGQTTRTGPGPRVSGRATFSTEIRESSFLGPLFSSVGTTSSSIRPFAPTET